jgi:hypothetical protein
VGRNLNLGFATFLVSVLGVLGLKGKDSLYFFTEIRFGEGFFNSWVKRFHPFPEGRMGLFRVFFKIGVGRYRLFLLELELDTWE